MPTPSTHRVALIEHMSAEWRSLGRGPAAVRALRALAPHDPALARLVWPQDGSPAHCPTPYDLVEHMRRARGRAQREEAAHIVRVLLREAGSDPCLGRILVQALLPGLVTVAGRLRWGHGGEWQDGEEFFGELVATTWLVIEQWSGQDRPYAVLDLLSAVRCRLRRQLFAAKEAAGREVPLVPDGSEPTAAPGTHLEDLARMLLDLHLEGMPTEDVQVLYAHHVLGYSMAELAALTGRDRRVLYARRDRGRRRLCA